MGQAISFTHRQKIVQRRQRGETYSKIAEAYGFSVSGVKKIWYDFQNRGEDAFKTNYSNSGRPSPYSSEIRKKVSEIRDNEQGGNYVASKFRQRYPDLTGPSARTLQRWWAQSGTANPQGRPKEEIKKTGVKNLMGAGN